MAVCNLFSDLTSDSGNFLMFSQYTEDITKGFIEGDNYKVVPSKFIALNIDFSELNISSTNNLNIDIPKYFQNYYENGCAYGKNNIEWNPNYAKNFLLHAMYFGNFLTEGTIQCINDINLQSYNIHSGMGYGEIYCYIPTNKKQEQYVISYTQSNNINLENTSNTLEGFDTEIGDYNKIYYYDENVIYSKSKDIENATSYNINAIVILYSIVQKTDDKWNTLYTDIPMGIYFTGKFNDGANISNPITKFVDTDYDTGTAYGLRICTRFTATSQGKVINTDISTSTNTGEMNNICQFMCVASENLSKMFEITKSSINENQYYKDLIAMIKNNKSNVPYIRNINGKNYWFVNGKLALDSPILVESTETT